LRRQETHLEAFIVGKNRWRECWVQRFSVAEEFGDGREAFLRHAVEAALLVEQAFGGEDVEVRAEDEV